MTVCPYCLDNMAARSVKQLSARKLAMKKHPQVKVGPCPSCQGTEWATTDQMIWVVPPTDLPPVRKQASLGFWIAVVVIFGLLLYVVVTGERIGINQ